MFYLLGKLLAYVSGRPRIAADKAHLIADSIVFGTVAASFLPFAVAILGFAVILLLLFA